MEDLKNSLALEIINMKRYQKHRDDKFGLEEKLEEELNIYQTIYDDLEHLHPDAKIFKISGPLKTRQSVFMVKSDVREKIRELVHDLSLCQEAVASLKLKVENQREVVMLLEKQMTQLGLSSEEDL